MIAASLWCEDVDRDECVVREEAGFENRRCPVVDQLAGERDALGVRIVGKVDEHAAREAIAGEHTDLRAFGETVLEHFVGLELDGERFVDLPPEQVVALGAGDEARFGKAVGQGVMSPQLNLVPDVQAHLPTYGTIRSR